MKARHLTLFFQFIPSIIAADDDKSFRARPNDAEAELIRIVVIHDRIVRMLP